MKVLQVTLMLVSVFFLGACTGSQKIPDSSKVQAAEACDCGERGWDTPPPAPRALPGKDDKEAGRQNTP